MLELGVGTDILRALGSLYVALIAVLIGASLWFPKRWWMKVAGVVAVLIVFTGPAYLRSQEREKAVEERKARYQQAKALFDERCKMAGEKIYRTASEVEGILLLEPRPDITNADWADRDWKYAGLPGESGGDWYIKSFLLWEHLQANQHQRDANRAARSYLNSEPSLYPGYQHVDAPDSNGTVRRYRLAEHGKRMLSATIDADRSSRYIVSVVDLDPSLLRRHWIGGAKVTITDSLNHEVIAEGTWYAFEPGLGNVNGNRSPWAFANSCPQSGAGGSPIRFFVDQVLKPRGG